MSEQTEYIDAENHIILAIPPNTVHLDICATCICEDGKTIQCGITLYGDELAKARQDFLDEVGDDDYGAFYALAEKGREELAQLEDDRK